MTVEEIAKKYYPEDTIKQEGFVTGFSIGYMHNIDRQFTKEDLLYCYENKEPFEEILLKLKVK